MKRLVATAVSVSLSGCVLFDTNKSDTNSNTGLKGGTLSVELGFGAIASSPYQCTGDDSITVEAVSLAGSVTDQ
ncbi:hypothetical protein HSX11_11045 [Oxalobacteraceae bacterium]|nr:hypothetical protein [Oxalobacteraceae bacterium]